MNVFEVGKSRAPYREPEQFFARQSTAALQSHLATEEPTLQRMRPFEDMATVEVKNHRSQPRRRRATCNGSFEHQLPILPPRSAMRRQARSAARSGAGRARRRSSGAGDPRRSRHEERSASP
jgi:hypothetical protein